MNFINSPPVNESELLERAFALSGKSLAEIADSLGALVPSQLTHAKGWAGQLLEMLLGATAGNLAEPDFQELGIELKTIPLNHKGLASESTYVCIAPLKNTAGLSWENSLVKQKLSRVLWIPILRNINNVLGQQQIGIPYLWSPTSAEEAILRHDWEDLIEMISLGQLEYITARHGEWLQIRPKAANAKALSYGIDEWGNQIATLPRGFYLRAKFTRQLLANKIMPI